MVLFQGLELVLFQGLESVPGFIMEVGESGRVLSHKNTSN